MNRVLLGTLAGLLLVVAGLFWWQGRVETEVGRLPLDRLAAAPPTDTLPLGGAGGAVGAAPPEASEATREQRRFDRLDRDRDGRVTRTEMLLPRVPAFRKLDANSDNLLSFEEWAGRTGARFAAADADRTGWLTRAEYATTAPKRKPKPACRCAPARQPAGARPRRAAPPQVDEPDPSDDDEAADPAV